MAISINRTVDQSHRRSIAPYHLTHEYDEGSLSRKAHPMFPSYELDPRDPGRSPETTPPSGEREQVGPDAFPIGAAHSGGRTSRFGRLASPRAAATLGALMMGEVLFFCVIAAFFHAPQALHIALILVVANAGAFATVWRKRPATSPKA